MKDNFVPSNSSSKFKMYKFIFRFFVVIVSYALSSLGLICMRSLIAEEYGSPKGASFGVYIWGGAWIMHLVMSVTWIADIRLHRAWPLLGTVLGVASFLIWPFHAMRLDAPPQSVLLIAVQFVGFQLVLVAPCLVLASWLLKYHYAHKTVRE